MAQKTIMQTVADHLIAHGYRVYTPTQAIGVVTDPYIVIQYLGSAKHTSFSTIIERYSVILFLPHRLYSELQTHIQGIEGTMQELHPQLVYDDFGGTPIYDDDMQCYQIQTDYLTYKKMTSKITPLRKQGG